MEVITIEKKAFEALLAEANGLVRQVELLTRTCQDRWLQKWLTSEEVCAILKISQRTLQSMRSKHQICYTQLGRKFYYRPEEIELLFTKSSKYHRVSS